MTWGGFMQVAFELSRGAGVSCRRGTHTPGSPFLIRVRGTFASSH